MDYDCSQYVITFEANAQYENSQAVHDMLNMITGHDGHIDFIIESNSNPAYKAWTIVYTSCINLNIYCPKSCCFMYK